MIRSLGRPRHVAYRAKILITSDLDSQINDSDCPQVCCELSSPCLSRLNFRTFRLQQPHYHFTCLSLTRYLVRSPCKPSYRPSELHGQTSQSSLGRCVGSEVHHLPVNSPTGLAESSSPYSYGLFIRLWLLSTLSVENAVTIDYGAVTDSPIRTFTR